MDALKDLCDLWVTINEPNVVAYFGFVMGLFPPGETDMRKGVDVLQRFARAHRVAVDAIRSANSPHHFLSVTKSGHTAIVSTMGNEDCHVILRGGREPNFDAASVDKACKELGVAGLAARVMVDFSHGNSRKDFKRQMEAARDVAGQLAAGEDRIFGVMVESHLKEGRQDLVPGKPLDYGKSITDACLGWEDSLAVLGLLAQAVRDRRIALLDKE